jgi:uncharacterized membrane protein YphA (DoxX/SURF4 family)
MTSLQAMLFRSPWPYRVVRICLGAIFVWAGAVKLVDPRAFARVISGYGLVPESLLVSVAIGLAALELVAGLGLVFDVRHSLKLVCTLVVMFLVVLGYGIWNQIDVDCGCFSVEEIHAQRSLRTAFLRDLGLMAAVAYLFWWRWLRERLGDECGSGV